MKTAEEMTRDVLKRRDAELVRIRRKRKILAGSAVLAACLILLAVTVPRLLREAPKAAGESGTTGHESGTAGLSESASVQSPADVTAVPPESAEEPERRICWTGEGLGAIPQMAEEAASPGTDDRVSLEPRLQEMLQTAGEDEELAFVFAPHLKREGSPYDQEKQDALYQAYTEAEAEAYDIHEKLVQELMEGTEMTPTEADARVSSMPAYREARRAFHRAELAIEIEQNRAIYAGTEESLQVLRERGFTVLCDNSSDGYTGYRAWSFGLAVCTGTAEMIRGLADAPFGEDIPSVTLYATLPVEPDPDGGDIIRHLREGTQLTDELLDAYARNGGAPLTVVVKMGWTGEWVDPHEYAYAALGMSGREFNEAMDLTNEQVDLYYEVLHYYTYWVREDTVEPLLRDGELIEIRSWMWDFVAELSYERALEICEYREGNVRVGYITLKSLEDRQEAEKTGPPMVEE